MTKFHYYAKHNFTPELVSHFDYKFLRRSIWKVQNRDGSYGKFVSWWIVNHLQLYSGSSKCDGSESHLADRIVMTDKPSELRAFRWRRNGPGQLNWDNIGGS